MVVGSVRPVCRVGPVKLPNYKLPNSQLNEVGADAAECAAGEESSERTGDERPYRFRDSLGHFKPINFQFHVVFLSCCVRVGSDFRRVERVETCRTCRMAANLFSSRDVRDVREVFF